MNKPDGNIARIGAVVAATGLMLWLVKGFIVALLLAVVFAAISRPLYKKILLHTGGKPWLASIITLTFLILLAFIPGLILVQLLAVDTLSFLARVAPSMREEVILLEGVGGSLPDWVPFQEQLLEALPKIKDSIVAILTHIGQYLLEVAKNATLNTLKFIVELLVLIYAMAFLVQLDKGGIPLILRYSGLPESTRLKLTDRILAVGRSTVRGTLIIGFVQGALLGVAFYFAGIDHVFYWFSIATVISFLPAVGTILIWAPAVVFLALSGQGGAAVGMFLWGAFVISMADNVLRPIVVGRKASIPDVMVLVTTLGGLVTLGASAIILGPIAAGIFLTVWEDLRETSAADDQESSDPDG